MDVNFQLSTERDILISIAERVKSLDQKISTICQQVERHEQELQSNKLTSHEQSNLIHEILKNNIRVSEETTTAIRELTIVLKAHQVIMDETKPIITWWKSNDTDIKLLVRWWRWILTGIGVVIISVTTYLTTRNLDK